MKLISAKPGPVPPKPGEKIVVVNQSALVGELGEVADAVVSAIIKDTAEVGSRFEVWVWNADKQNFFTRDEGLLWARAEAADALRTVVTLRRQP